MPFTTIVSGGTVSEVFAIHSPEPLGIWAPVVTSCQIALQVSFSTVSAQMVRAGRHGVVSDVSSTWIWDVGPGSAAMIAAGLASFQFARIETLVAQTDTRTFAIMQRA